MPRPMKPLKPVCQQCKQVLTKNRRCRHGKLLCQACCRMVCLVAVPLPA